MTNNWGVISVKTEWLMTNNWGVISVKTEVSAKILQPLDLNVIYSLEFA